MKVLITGVAGFIGASLAKALKSESVELYGVDDLNDYYDQNLKRARLHYLANHVNFTELDIADSHALYDLFDRVKPELVIHLAAQAGVRHSFKAPMDYARSNLSGHVSLLEAVRNTTSVRQLIYASSSSVYSGIRKQPFTEEMRLSTPKSLYAASKIANELLCDTYCELHEIDMIGLRFFTVYGPWGRPDMAYWKFSEAILEDRPLTLFNFGEVSRDFTYIDDVTEAISRMVGALGNGPATTRSAKHRLYNVGNCSPTRVGQMIENLETILERKANIVPAALPPGDVVSTYADVEKLSADFGYSPETALEDGLKQFAKWYLDWRIGKYQPIAAW